MNAYQPMPDFTTALQERLERLQYWRAYIEKALARNNSLTTFTDIVVSVVRGDRIFFDNGKAFAILQPDVHPSGTAMFIYVAGGEYAKMCELEQQIVDYSRSVGACRLTALARHGFNRRKSTGGWKTTKQMWWQKEI